MQIELAPNFKVLLDSWNMKTNVWLRECVYKRVTPKGKKPGNLSSMLTFLTSAFWVSFFDSIEEQHPKRRVAWYCRWVLPCFFIWWIRHYGCATRPRQRPPTAPSRSQ